MKAFLQAITMLVTLAISAVGQNPIDEALRIGEPKPIVIRDPAPKSVALDVCNVVAKPQDFADKTIIMNGVIASSEEELAILCKGANRRVWLDFPDDKVVKEDTSLKGQTLTFHRSKASDSFINFLLQKCSERRFAATLRGYFQHRKDFSDTRPNGYGHLGTYEFRLVITDVEQVQGEPCEATM